MDGIEGFETIASIGALKQLPFAVCHKNDAGTNVVSFHHSIEMAESEKRWRQLTGTKLVNVIDLPRRAIH